MTCDHVASKASLRTFVASTARHVIQQTDKETLLLGNCKGCNSTIAVEVDLARGHVVSGEIETDAETMDEHARRVIR